MLIAQGNGLFILWGRAIHSRGTGCSLQGDGLFTPGGRAALQGDGLFTPEDGLLTLGGRAAHSRGTGCSLPGGRAVHSRGTGCTPGGRAIHSRGRAVRSMGTGYSVQVDGLFALEGERVIQSIIRRTSFDRQAWNIKSI